MARQVLVSPSDIRDGWAEIRGSEARHLVRVLRVEAGERVSLFDGLGTTYRGVVDEVTRKGVRVRIEESLAQERSTRQGPLITLVQAIPKQRGMELIVSQCAQLGIERVVPVITERTEVKIDPEDPGPKPERWKRLAQETAKQCGTAQVTRLEQVVDLAMFFHRLEPYDLSLIATLEEPVRPLKEVLAEFKNSHRGKGGQAPATPSAPRAYGPKGPARVAVLVGPEGDFTPAEVAQARSHDFQPVSLGPTVLRSPTAAVVVCALIRYELGD
ncbi:MAG: 16S rRNA (uracil(1498)-N(3))-methyltransferase [Candidatus Omnitrophica bacterium]|nr:16S rRNA (uracil(1498)-N(3))-methyltransferase [Candidatus Omnitrophota bacterium]